MDWIENRIQYTSIPPLTTSQTDTIRYMQFTRQELPRLLHEAPGSGRSHSGSHERDPALAASMSCHRIAGPGRPPRCRVLALDFR